MTIFTYKGKNRQLCSVKAFVKVGFTGTRSSGLSVPAFEKVCNVEDPFYCNFCLGQQQDKQIKAFQVRIATLESLLPIDTNSQSASYAQIISEQSSTISKQLAETTPKQPRTYRSTTWFF